ncbi:MAG: hypothetical protein CVU57_00470 [Deltaproteobacteria bacterium HGW-Deltaproteobacteria-15]|jgi:SAM-dependent methyltransferase|nr:MAG: hypothetical protein CVU57_00470 [Deltaproteobacteria bacterium HGW-Deltaproteobacteria-15]
MQLTPDGYHLIDKETATRRGNNIHFGPAGDLLRNLGNRLGRPPLTLDCGCGSGQFGAMLQAGGVPHLYVGVDVDREQLKAGRTFYGAGQYLVADIASLPFRDEAFDAVMSYGVLFIIQDMWEAVRELYRVASSLVVMNLNVAPLGSTAMRLHYGKEDESYMWLPNVQNCMDRFQALGLPAPDASILWETPEDVGHSRKVYRGVTHRFNASFVWYPTRGSERERL